MTDSLLPLSGSCALVTGASRRLGRAIAERLAEAGADVAVHCHRDEEGAARTAANVRAKGRRAEVLGADLRDAEACTRLVAEAEARLGPLDLLVNNAAVFRRTPLETLDVAAFDEHMAVNARAVHVLSAEAGRRMKARGRGAIVNLACVSGLRPWARFIPYSASKATVINLTRGFALALGPEVRVNAVAPGPILPAEDSTAERDHAAARATLLQRWGTPSDITAAVLFLATASWLTGVVLPVDGGRSIA
jgi:NAD(P)-dependent dehydrogenase (short-subunit alcohol dehydrogenase family)